jgi:MGT family glycosyltransferase
MSLGTVFNYNSFIFERAIEAFGNYDTKSDRQFKSSQFRVVISTGESTLKLLKEKANKGELNLPDNILLQERVPQLEVLKRADLFITHSGMNSTSEAIKYGVPMICIPLEADQPFVAKRVCELSLGVRIDPRSISADKIADSVDKVLSETNFKKNMKDLSKLSSNYHGSVEGARLIMEMLNQNGINKKSD